MTESVGMPRCVSNKLMLFEDGSIKKVSVFRELNVNGGYEYNLTVFYGKELQDSVEDIPYVHINKDPENRKIVPVCMSFLSTIQGLVHMDGHSLVTTPVHDNFKKLYKNNYVGEFGDVLLFVNENFGLKDDESAFRHCKVVKEVELGLDELHA